MARANPEAPREGIVEKIKKIPILGSVAEGIENILMYPFRHPIKTFFYATLGLSAARHMGFIEKMSPNIFKTALDKSAELSQRMYMAPVNALGTQIGGYPWYVSGPAKVFANTFHGISGNAPPYPRVP